MVILKDICRSYLGGRGQSEQKKWYIVSHRCISDMQMCMMHVRMFSTQDKLKAVQQPTIRWLDICASMVQCRGQRPHLCRIIIDHIHASRAEVQHRPLLIVLTMPEK